jgi:predicted Rossmann-fold nucleotide-binding protein
MITSECGISRSASQALTESQHHGKPASGTVTRRLIEIESLADFDTHIGKTRRLNGWFVQSVDLTERADLLLKVDPRGAVFLGCHFTPTVEDYLRRSGALLFPQLPDLPFDPYRAEPYDALELYGDRDYASSLDATIYAWSHAQPIGSLAAALSTTLHDHSVTDALDDVTSELEPRNIVGIMGGHDLSRTDDMYRAAAELGASLTRAGRTVLTGGGPGAMEAANLGAYLSGWPASLDEALTIMKPAPSYRPSIDAWAESAFRVRTRWPISGAGRSLSIPTWFYGHEPTNVFATEIAKYFSNALREDTLLNRCSGGIVYLPGRAGTVQEIFQAVTENFYAADATLIAALILVGRQYWTETYPAWPLLRRLGADRPMGESIHCVDSVKEATDLLTS